MSQRSFSFSLFGNSYFFTPKFTLITLCIFTVLITLGIWQWELAKQMNATIELVNKRLLLDPIQADALEKDSDWRYFSAVLQGTFDNEHNILIKNRFYNGQRGFQVLTPLKLDNSVKTILVNRGWIPESDAEKITASSATPNNVTLSGVLFKPAEHLITDSLDEKKTTWPLQITNPNIEKLGKLLNTPIYPYILLLSPSSEYGFIREWLWLSSGTGADRHKAYARQCFMFALVLLLVFIFLNIHQKEI